MYYYTVIYMPINGYKLGQGRARTTYGYENELFVSGSKRERGPHYLIVLKIYFSDYDQKMANMPSFVICSGASCRVCCTCCEKRVR